MTTKKDNPASNKRPADAAPGAKKPYATLDLKAKEIKSAEKAATGSLSAAKPTEKLGDKPATPKTPDKTAAPTEKKPDPAAAKSKPSATSSQTRAQSAAPASPRRPQRPPAKSGLGLGGLFSHLSVGVIGGLLALVGAETFAPKILPQLGLDSQSAKTQVLTAALDQRIAALETSNGTSSAAENAASNAALENLASLEQRIDNLDELSGSIKKLTAAQADLTQRTEALASGAGDGSAGGELQTRIATMEDQLNTMAAAAGNTPDAGSLPQLAAITGRISDLETELNDKVAVLRDSVAKDIEDRTTQSAEAAEAARLGTQRLNRQVATLQEDTARTNQRLETIKADNTRVTETLRVLNEESGSLRSGLDALTSDVEDKFGRVSRPSDVAQALLPVTEKVASLEDRITSVVQSEVERETNAQRIVLSLQLANLKRAMERGQGFAAELSEVKKLAGDALDLSALEAFATSGVPTVTELQTSFRPVAHAIIDSQTTPAEGSVIDQLLAGAKSIVRVRRTDHAPDDNSTEAVVARMEQALHDGQLGSVLDMSKTLPDSASQPAGDWLSKTQARHAVDKALASIEGQLKASLGNGTADADIRTE